MSQARVERLVVYEGYHSVEDKLESEGWTSWRSFNTIELGNPDPEAPVNVYFRQLSQMIREGYVAQIITRQIAHKGKFKPPKRPSDIPEDILGVDQIIYVKGPIQRPEGWKDI